MSAGLRNALYKKVFRGHRDPFNYIVSVASSASFIGGTLGQKVGLFLMDRSASDFYICTATTGTGTWVKINA
jgi:hypothetical protein